MMLINEVCKECSLTKKAIEYYMEQGLISPSVRENGYRDFSDEDVDRLKKISVLRSLGLSVAEIQDVLSGEISTALNEISNRQRLQISVMQEKQELIQELAANHDWKNTHDKLEQLKIKQSVLERLLNVFPGYYGRFICLHFAPYLNEPILTAGQQEAFYTIIAFLDNVEFDLPADLQKYLDEVMGDVDDAFVESIYGNVNNAIKDMEKYIDDNQQIIEIILDYKQSEEYKTTQAYHLENTLRKFNSTSGYDDIFIPAMCRLSDSYQKYHEAVLQADEKFARKYPQYIQKYRQEIK